MNLLPYLLDILKYIIAGVAILSAAFYLVRPYLDKLDKSEKIALLEFRKSITSQSMPLRLQAYERLVLFIERSNPTNMLVRMNATSYSAYDLHLLIIEEIRTEFQHNITQQVYVSSRAWGVVKQVKDDTLNIVNNAYRSLTSSASGLDLSKMILGALSQLDENPYEIGAELIRKDVEQLF